MTTYTPAQKKAIYKWREENKEEFNAKQNERNKKWRKEHREEYRERANNIQQRWRKWKSIQKEYFNILIET